MTPKDKKSIILEGVKLTKEHFPVLFEWAEKNPDTLAENLRASAKRFKCKPSTVAVNLESDLAHDRALVYRDEEE